MSTLKDALVEKKDEIKKVIKDGGNGSNSGEDIDGLKIRVEIKDDDTEIIKAQAKKTSEIVYSSAGDYYKMLKRIDSLENIPDIGLIPEKMNELVQLKIEKERIYQHLYRQHQAVRDQFAINVLIVEINDCQPTHDADVLDFLYFAPELLLYVVRVVERVVDSVAHALHRLHCYGLPEHVARGHEHLAHVDF